MKLLDLFAGLGGFSLAAHWMGWETAAFVEKEPFCQKVLRKNFGQDIEIHDDIFNFSGTPFRGRIDIITGGFPCQPFSAAGKRKGRADERHLFPQMLRVISEVRPRWVVAENVRGLLSIESGSVFSEVITSLESEGYEVITFCIPASAVEAPHRRDRLWIVAHAVGRGPDSDVADPEHERWNDRLRPETGRDSDRDGRTSASRGDRGLGRLRSDIGPDGADASNPNHELRIGRGEQGQDRERSIQTGRGNGRPLGESAIGCGDVTDADKRRTGTVRESAVKAVWICGRRTVHAPDTSDPRLQGSEQPGTFSEGTRAPRSVAECDSDAENASGERARSESGAITDEGRRTSEDRRAGLRCGNGTECSGRAVSTNRNGWDEPWIEAATRFCRVDAELSSELDIVGARDNRVSRLKVLGNAVVPALVFEIFKAIEASEESRNAR